MDTIEFGSLEELYNRVKPALYSKLRELYRLGYKIVSEKDIWNYLVEKTWNNKKNLELCDLVSDILYVDNYSIYDYSLNNLKNMKRESDNKDSNIL